MIVCYTSAQDTTPRQHHNSLELLGILSDSRRGSGFDYLVMIGSYLAADDVEAWSAMTPEPSAVARRPGLDCRGGTGAMVAAGAR